MRWFLGLGLLILGVGCQSPVIITGERAHLEAQFLVQGFPEASPTPAVSEEGPTSRLLIAGQADTLTVTITPLAAGLSTPSPQVIPISGSGAVTVVFPDLILGLYRVDAVATQSGVERFRRSTKVNLSSSNMAPVSFSLAAVANQPSPLTLAHQNVTVGSGKFVTYSVPIDQNFLGDGFYLGGSTNILAYPQTAEGDALPGQPTDRVFSLRNANLGRSWLITLYNNGVNSETFPMGIISLAQVPGGKFQYSATATDVAQVRSFSIGKFEVTQALYYAVLSEPSNTLTPITNISYLDMATFCNQLSAKLGLEQVYTIPVTGGIPTADLTKNGYRLPTEMEWWWAAMGGPGDGQGGGINTSGWNKAYSGGTDVLQISNFAVINGTPISQVGTKNRNELGIYDMTGNVAEMVLDFPGAISGSIPMDFCQTSFSGYYLTKGSSNSGYPYSVSIDLRTQYPGTGLNLGFRIARR